MMEAMRRIVSFHDRVIDLLGFVAILLVAFLTLGIAADVLIRNTGFGVIRGMLELSEYALFLITFLGAPWVLRQNGHIRIDVVLRKLPEDTARRLDGVASLAGAAVAGCLAYYAANVALQSHAAGARVIKEFIFPEWWIFAVVGACSVVLAIEFLLRLTMHRGGATARGPSGF